MVCQETWQLRAQGLEVVGQWHQFGWTWGPDKIWRKIYILLTHVLVGVLEMVVLIILTAVCLHCQWKWNSAKDSGFIIWVPLKPVTLHIVQHLPSKILFQTMVSQIFVFFKNKIIEIGFFFCLDFFLDKNIHKKISIFFM